MDRVDWDQYFINIAKAVATRATCHRKHVGAVIVKDKRILSTGYNGSIRGTDHCGDDNHLMEDGHCVTGDVVISRFQTAHYNTRHSTVAKIYENWQDGVKRAAMRKINIRAMNSQGIIVPDRIVDIWSKGVKPTFFIKTFLGRETRVTEEHLFYTPEGWVALKDLRVDGKVAVNGQPLLDDIGWLRKKYIDEGLTQVQIAALVGSNRQAVRRKLQAAGITIRPFKLGGWNKGFIREKSHSYKGTNTDNAPVLRSRARRYALAPVCNVCGSHSNLQVHHIDENIYNDDAENLITLCISCHTIAHTPHAKVESIVFDTITQIREAPAVEVFDLQTETHHNFIGDGLVLHNCVRTIHAECNAILQAAMHGVAINDSTLYVTALPCWPCFKMVANAGIKEIIYGEFYRGNEHIERLREHASRVDMVIRSIDEEQDAGRAFFVYP